MKGIVSFNKIPVFFRRLPTHIIVAASAFFSKVIIALIQLITVRILIQGLGNEKYAVFAVLTSLMGWYSLTDFGIGVSLQNYISECRASGKEYKPYLIASGLLSFFIIMFFLFCLFLLTPSIEYLLFSNFKYLSLDNTREMVFFSGLFFSIASLGGIGYKVWYGEQRGYLSNLFPSLAYILGLLLIVTVLNIPLFRNKLLWTSLAFTFPLALLAFLAYILTHRKVVSFKFNLVKDKVISLTKRGFKFWVFGLMGAFVLQIDYIVMAQTLKAQDITNYNVLSKIFMFFYFIYYSALLALWPVISEKLTRKQWLDVISTIKKYILSGWVLIFLLTLVFLFLKEPIMNLFSPHDKLEIETLSIILFFVFFIVRSWTDTYSIALQSINDLYIFWRWVPVHAFFNVVLQWVLSKQFGINGIIIGLTLSYVLSVAWVLPLRLKKHYLKYLEQG